MSAPVSRVISSRRAARRRPHRHETNRPSYPPGPSARIVLSGHTRGGGRPCTGAGPAAGRCATRAVLRPRVPVPRVPACRVRRQRRGQEPGAVHGAVGEREVPARQRGRDLSRDQLRVRHGQRRSPARVLRHAGHARVRDPDVPEQRLRDDVLAARGVRRREGRVDLEARCHVLGGHAVLQPPGRPHQRLLLPRPERLWRGHRGHPRRGARAPGRGVDRRLDRRTRPERHRSARGTVSVQQELARPAALAGACREVPPARRRRSLAFQRRCGADGDAHRSPWKTISADR